MNSFEDLIGLEISEAKKTLGHWYVLTLQDASAHWWFFERAGVHKVRLVCDNNNIVEKYEIY